MIRLLIVVSLLLFAIVPSHAEGTDKQVKDVAKELACLCNTCPRRPLDECTCGWAVKIRNRIAEALASGQTKETVIAGFVADFGLEAYSAPPAEGFNLSAWVMPFVVLFGGGLLVVRILRRWHQTATSAAARGGTAPAADDPYLDRLERELGDRNS